MSQMETEPQAPLEQNKQPDSPAFPLHKQDETKESKNYEDREMRIIIIGACKSGKSTAKDVLLGEEYLTQKATASQSSSTIPTAVMTEREKGDMYLKVLDTPDLDCLELKDEKKAKEEIEKWKAMCPDPHLILLAIRCDTRDLVSDVSRFQRFRMLWGDNLRRRFAVLFTFGDKLQESVDEFLSRSHSALQDIMDCAGHHYVIFNRSLSASEQKGRAQQVFQIVKDLKNVLNVLIIGKTGNGKSSTGNSLLKTPAFSVSRGLSSSTKHTVTQSAQINDLIVKVTDTPDVSNLGIDEKAAEEEIKKWCFFHPDAILLAVRCDLRYTPEEYQIYQQIKKALGEQYIRSRLTVAFTFGDRQDRNIDEELKTVCTDLKDVLRDAEDRYITFSNTTQKDLLFELMNSVPVHGDVFNVLIIGKTGNGKSSLGNSLLRAPAFSIKRGLSSSTQDTVTKSAHISDKTVTVMDTPDVSNLGIEEKIAEQEIRKWHSFHPHIILLAVRCDLRYTAEEHQIYQQIKKGLGEEYLQSKLRVAFTFGDRQDRDIEEELETVCTELKDVLKDANRRYFMFSNKTQKDPEHNNKDPLTCIINTAFGNAERMRGSDVDSSLSASDPMHVEVNELKSEDPVAVKKRRKECDAADSDGVLAHPSMPVSYQQQCEEIRIIIIGASGSGKSTAANVLLREDMLQMSSTNNPVSPTTCQLKQTDTQCRRVKVLDTPDLGCPELRDEKKAREEIQMWKAMCPDPHLILLAIRCDTPELISDVSRFQRFVELWGDNLKRRLVVLFTFGDRLKKSIDEFMASSSSALHQVMDCAGHRYVIFDRSLSASQQRDRAQQVFQIVKDFKNVVNILIVGKTGNGKSSVGNSLLKTPAFSVTRGLLPSTKHTVTQSAQINDLIVKVTDTPDVSNLGIDEKAAEEEIKKWCFFHPDAILLAIRCDLRYTPEEYQIYQQIKKALGEQYLRSRLTVAFTYGDRQDRNIDEELKTVCTDLKDVLRDAEDRYITFSNTTQKDLLVELMNSAPVHGDVFNVLIIGKTGNGKSSLGNSLLRAPAFSIKRGLSSSTQDTVTKSAHISDKTVTVMDTPDVSNLGIEEKIAEQEIRKWHSFHPHIILLAVRCDIRYTAEEHQIYQQIKKVLGEEYLQSKLRVAFTFGDRQDRDIEEELQTVCTELKDVLKDANRRYFMFSNKAQKDPEHNNKDPLTCIINTVFGNAERMRGSDVDSSLSASDQKHGEINELKHTYENTQTEVQPCPSVVVETQQVLASKTRQLKVLIVGKTGNGKSTLGNRLLNSTSAFRVARGLKSSTTFAVTNSAQIKDLTVTVMDTPDVSNLGVDEKGSEEEIKKWCSFDPHVILLAVRCDLRYTAEEYQIYQQIKKVLGEEYLQSKLTVAFTFGDRQDKNIHEELKTVCTELQDVLKDAKNRYIMVSKDDLEDTIHGHLDCLIKYAHDHESEDPVAVKKRRKECDAADSDGVLAHPAMPVSCNGADTNAVQQQCEEIRITIIGASGSGKSTAANVLLGEDMLQMSSANNPVSPTTCQLKQTETQCRRVKVLDTPDLGCPELQDEKKAREEIQKWKAMCPDPHLILLAIRCDTPELISDVSRFQRFVELWGDNLKRRLVVLFTFGDRLKKSIDEFMVSSSSALHQVMDCAGHRYVIFDSSLSASQQRDRAQQVFQIVKDFKNVVNILIVGKTGNGKSSIGNSLLKTPAFSVSRGLSSSTKDTVTQSAQINDIIVKVTDTPDVSNLGIDEKAAEEEIKKWCFYHPDAMLLAIRCDIRYTPEEYQIYQQIKNALGEQYLRSRLTVAFTYGDRQDRNIDEELKTVCTDLKDVLRDAEDRYIMFSNTTQKDPLVELMNSVPVHGDVFNVLMIGKTGNGKSSLGNSLLRAPAFSIKRGLSSSTQDTVTKSAHISDKTVTVMDTPDVSNLGIEEKIAEQEIRKWNSFHPHIILLAVRCDIRYTAEEYQIYQQIKKVLGEEYLQSKLRVAFTFGDRQDRDIEEELETVCTELKDVLKDANRRYFMFSNKTQKDPEHNNKDPLTCIINTVFGNAERMRGSDVDSSLSASDPMHGEINELKSEDPVTVKKRRKECDAADSDGVLAHPAMPVSCNGADTNATQHQCEEIRIIIIGASGSGKSTAANILLREHILQMSSTNNPVSPTTCQLKQTETQCRRVKVLDTPDIDCPELQDEKKAMEEIEKWKAMCPDPHLILLAIRCDTPDLISDVSRFQRFVELWGDNLKRRLVVLFTFGDRLKKSIDEFMVSSSSALHQVMDCAGHRYVIFDSSLSASEQKGRADQVFNIVNELKNGFRVMIIGKTGNGKSTLGNSLLNTAAFRVTRGLATSTKQTVTASAQNDGLTITVADTPDVSNLGVEEITAEQEIRKSYFFHPDVILLAIRCDLRYTPEEYQIYQQIKKVLGEDYLRSRLIVAFTFGDRQDRDINEELKTVCTELKNVLEDAGQRYILFNKEDKEDKRHEHFMRLKKFVFDDGNTRRPKRAQISDGNVTTAKEIKLPTIGASETVHNIESQLPGRVPRMEAPKEMKSSGKFFPYCDVL